MSEQKQRIGTQILVGVVVAVTSSAILYALGIYDVYNGPSGPPIREASASDGLEGTQAPPPSPSWKLVGFWKASVFEQGMPVEVYWNIRQDGTSSYNFVSPSGTFGDQGSWRYSNEMIYETYQNGGKGQGQIQWLNDNRFRLTIVDNGIPNFQGLVRIYERQ